MSRRRRRRKPQTLSGLGLYIDPRSGIYIWRRVNRRTGRRELRSTGSRNLKTARKIAETFTEEQELREHGLKVHDWQARAKPLAEEWVENIEGEVLERTRRQTELSILRALSDLDINVLADLDDIDRLQRRLEALGHPPSKMRRQYQEPLKRFSKWLCRNNAHLDRDPLANWANIRESKAARRNKLPRRRAVRPDEMARAIRAAEALDLLYKRKHPMAMVFKVLLVTAPRSAALTSRDVAHFHPEAHRIDLGTGTGNKRRGAGAIDEKTCAELVAYLGRRKRGPLLRSPKGSRLESTNLLQAWRETFSLSLVDALWPDAEEPDLELALIVARSLLADRVKVKQPGNPKRLKPETRQRFEDRKRQVAELMEALRPEWEARMWGVDVHAFRKTCHTWAEAQHVSPVLVNMQLGHAEQDRGALSAVLIGSQTGIRHYRDEAADLYDVQRVPRAVRALLDRELLALADSKRSPVAYGLAYMGDSEGFVDTPRIA